MRKCINIFQNLLENNKIIQNNIYDVFNFPTNIQIENIINILLDETKTIKEIFVFINKIIEDDQLLLINIVNEITLKIKNVITDITKLLYILEKLGDIEQYLTNDYNQKIQLYALISIFKINL